MLLFIFESIGSSEMILVGIVALIFLGPRKLPELAKKAGKIMSEFRGTANEFKQTWEKEANFEEELKSLNLSELDDEVSAVSGSPTQSETNTTIPDAPAIRAADPEQFKSLVPSQKVSNQTAASTEPTSSAASPNATDKKNWL